jgi:hypothetical protein
MYELKKFFISELNIELSLQYSGADFENYLIFQKENNTFKILGTVDIMNCTIVPAYYFMIKITLLSGN